MSSSSKPKIHPPQKPSHLNRMYASGEAAYLQTMKQRGHSARVKVTANPTTEEALHESEARYRRLFEDAVLGIFQSTAAGQLICANPAFLRMFGYDLMADFQQWGEQLVTALYADPQERERLVRQALESGSSVQEEVVYRRKDGSSFPGMLHMWTVRESSTGAEYLEGFVEDITERKQAEEVLRESEKKLRRVIEQSSEGIGLINEEGIFIEWNQSMEKITGLKREEVVGHPAWEIQSELSQKDGQTARALFQPVIEESLRTGQLPHSGQVLERQVRSREGGTLFVETASYPIKLEKGYMACVLMRDITKRVMAEKAEEEQRVLSEALRSTAEALTSSVGLDKVLECILINLKKVVPHDAANIMLVDSGIARIVRWQNYTIDMYQDWLMTARAFSVKDMGTFRMAAEMHRPLLSANTQTQPYWKEFSETHQIQSNILAPLEMEGRLIGFISVDSQTPNFFNQTHADHLQIFAYQAAIALSNAQMFANLENSHRELAQAYEATIEGWALALDLRDHETQGHTQRVAEWTMRLARAVEAPEEQLIHFRRGAILHDIGKVGIPDNILLKPGPLTQEEMGIMQMHCAYALRMLANIDYLKPALDIPQSHHEKWNGTGYPRKLRGKAIPLAARIFAIVDVWDALTSDRPYRPAWSREQALDYIIQQSGEHFDPQLVEVFIALMEKETKGQE